MAKKDFSRDFKGKIQLGSGSEKKQESKPVDPSPTPPEVVAPVEKPKEKKFKKTTQTGEVRYTFIADPTHLEGIQQMASVTKKPIKDLINSALDEYLQKHWNADKQAQFAELQKQIEKMRKEMGL